MTQKKQVNNQNGAVLNRDFPRRSRSLIIGAEELRRLFPNVKPEYIDLAIKRFSDYRFGDDENEIEVFGKENTYEKINHHHPRNNYGAIYRTERSADQPHVTAVKTPQTAIVTRTEQVPEESEKPAETREQCEVKLAEMIAQKKAEIAEEKAKLKEGAE